MRLGRQIGMSSGYHQPRQRNQMQKRVHGCLSELLRDKGAGH
jgi:hypothetical protein